MNCPLAGFVADADAGMKLEAILKSTDARPT